MNTIKKILQNRIFQIVISICLFLIIWQIIAVNSPRNRIPTPYNTFQMLLNILTTKGTFKHIWITTYRVVFGTIIGGIMGITIGILTKYSETTKLIVDKLIQPLIQSIPAICWAFIGILWFGLSNTTPILVVSLSTMPLFLINTLEGIKNLDEKLMEMGKFYSSNKLKIVTKIMIPLLLPFIYSGFKAAFIFAWKIVVLGEMYGSYSGMGYMISLAYDGFQINRILSWTIIFVIIINIFENYIFKRIDKYLVSQKLKIN